MENFESKAETLLEFCNHKKPAFSKVNYKLQFCGIDNF